jgi:type I restriction enzyme S subunit
MGYYNYLLKDNNILDSIFIYETGTANQGNLGIETIKRTMLQYPPMEEQQSIADYLDKKCGEIDTLISIKQQKIESLKEYKKSIIYEYVTGKKEVV